MGLGKMQHGAAWFLSALAWCCLLGCGSGPEVSRRKASQVKDINTVLVLPFQLASTYHDSGKTVRCLECDYFVQTGAIATGADTFMNDQLVALLESQTPYRPVPFWTAEGVSSQKPSQDLWGADLRLLVELGRSLQADAVVSGTIYRFRRRDGGPMAANVPASVSFALEFIRVSDGRKLWGRAFDETQRSLDENLLRLGRFLKKRGKLLTAEELATLGLKEVMTSFPVP
jgi:hypothetical protein